MTSHDCELEANLPRRRQKDELKLKALRIELEAGISALERGNCIEIDEADLENYLEDLGDSLGSKACRPCFPD